MVGRVAGRRHRLTGREPTRSAGRRQSAAAERYVDVGEVFLEALPVLEAVVTELLLLLRRLRRRLALSSGHHQIGEVREQSVGRGKRGEAGPEEADPARSDRSARSGRRIEERQHLTTTQI